eukprot:sb/3479586/
MTDKTSDNTQQQPPPPPNPRIVFTQPSTDSIQNYFVRYNTEDAQEGLEEYLTTSSDDGAIYINQETVASYASSSHQSDPPKDTVQSDIGVTVSEGVDENTETSDEVFQRSFDKTRDFFESLVGDANTPQLKSGSQNTSTVHYGSSYGTTEGGERFQKSIDDSLATLDREIMELTCIESLTTEVSVKLNNIQNQASSTSSATKENMFDGNNMDTSDAEKVELLGSVENLIDKLLSNIASEDQEEEEVQKLANLRYSTFERQDSSPPKRLRTKSAGDCIKKKVEDEPPRRSRSEKRTSHDRNGATERRQQRMNQSVGRSASSTNLTEEERDAALTALYSTRLYQRKSFKRNFLKFLSQNNPDLVHRKDIIEDARELNSNIGKSQIKVYQTAAKDGYEDLRQRSRSRKVKPVKVVGRPKESKVNKMNKDRQSKLTDREMKIIEAQLEALTKPNESDSDHYQKIRKSNSAAQTTPSIYPSYDPLGGLRVESDDQCTGSVGEIQSSPTKPPRPALLDHGYDNCVSDDSVTSNVLSNREPPHLLRFPIDTEEETKHMSPSAKHKEIRSNQYIPSESKLSSAEAKDLPASFKAPRSKTNDSDEMGGGYDSMPDEPDSFKVPICKTNDSMPADLPDYFFSNMHGSIAKDSDGLSGGYDSMPDEPYSFKAPRIKTNDSDEMGGGYDSMPDEPDSSKAPKSKTNDSDEMGGGYDSMPDEPDSFKAPRSKTNNSDEMGGGYDSMPDEPSSFKAPRAKFNDFDGLSGGYDSMPDEPASFIVPRSKSNNSDEMGGGYDSMPDEPVSVIVPRSKTNNSDELGGGYDSMPDEPASFKAPRSKSNNSDEMGGGYDSMPDEPVSFKAPRSKTNGSIPEDLPEYFFSSDANNINPVRRAPPPLPSPLATNHKQTKSPKLPRHPPPDPSIQAAKISERDEQKVSEIQEDFWEEALLHEEVKGRLDLQFSYSMNDLSSISFSDTEDDDSRDSLYHQHHYDDIAGLLHDYDPVAVDSCHVYGTDPDEISLAGKHQWCSDDQDNGAFSHRSHSATVMQGLINDLDYILVRKYREKQVVQKDKEGRQFSQSTPHLHHASSTLPRAAKGEMSKSAHLNGNNELYVEEVCKALGAYENEDDLVTIYFEKPPNITLSRFYRAFFNYDPRKDSQNPVRDTVFGPPLGDILEVVNTDDALWWQAKKYGTSAVGLVPSIQQRLQYLDSKPAKSSESPLYKREQHKKKKDFLFAFGEKEYKEPLTYLEVTHVRPSKTKRRPIVISGSKGWGGALLRGRILLEFPNKYFFPTKHTTKPGMENSFIVCTKKDFQEMVKTDKFIEYIGENGYYYGTSYQSVVDLLVRGRVPLLDVHPQYLPHIIGGNLRPHVIFVEPATEERIKDLKHNNPEALPLSQRKFHPLPSRHWPVWRRHTPFD